MINELLQTKDEPSRSDLEMAYKHYVSAKIGDFALSLMTDLAIKSYVAQAFYCLEYIKRGEEKAYVVKVLSRALCVHQNTIYRWCREEQYAALSAYREKITDLPA